MSAEPGGLRPKVQHLATLARRRARGLPRSFDELEATLSLMSDLRRWGWHDSVRAHRAQMMGEPVPWLTYPAVIALGRALTGAESVFEIGAGVSTLWFAAHAACVVSLEGDAAWAAELRPRLPENAELLVHPYSDAEGFFAKLDGVFGSFDVVLVDGGPDRSRVCRRAADFIADDGLIVLDNSDVSAYQPGIDGLAERGFHRIDFHGPAPATRYLGCTSFFSRRLDRWSPGKGSVWPRPIYEADR